MAAINDLERAFQWRRGAKLGSGSFGTVWQCTAVSDGKIFAVKSVAEGSACAALLRREHQILNQFSSDRIIRSFGHDTTTENGVRLYNMLLEYMAGGSVADALKKSGAPLQESILRCYLKDVLQALRSVHEQGFVHGDIKGANVLVSSDGRAKLADFGSATEILPLHLHDDDDSKDLRVAGTPLWSAPETLLLGEQSPESDVWSLGCLVVEMATGRPPWSNIICSETSAASAMFEIAYFADVPCVPEGALSAEAMDFLSKCLVRDASARWSCKQLLSHPFVRGESFRESSSSSVACFEGAPLSPVTPFDFGSKDWNLSLYSSGDSGFQDLGEVCSEQQSFANRDLLQPKQGSCRVPSARGRISRLASGDLDFEEEKAASVPGGTRISLFDDLGLPEQWIQVRGPSQTSSSSSPTTVPSSDCEQRDKHPCFRSSSTNFCSSDLGCSRCSSQDLASSVTNEPLLTNQRKGIRCSSSFISVQPPPPLCVSKDSIETQDFSVHTASHVEKIFIPICVSGGSYCN